LIGSAAAHVTAGWLVLHTWHATPAERIVEIDPQPTLQGETFDLPSDPNAGAANGPLPVDREPADDRGAATLPKPRGPATSGASADVPSHYGAVGERGSSELLPTFARAFAQAASGDPLWASAPLGDAGAVDMTFDIDEHGALVRTITGGTGTPPLRRGIERTMALIGGRTFVAGGAETRVRVAARIVSDEVHDGLHGDVFAIGASGTTAFFALAIGRRIDIDIVPIH
jgi:hypothetical protein